MITEGIGIFRTGIISFILLCGAITVFAQPKSPEDLELLDARNWNFSKRLPLKGTWNFSETKLIPPDSLEQRDLHSTFFPSLWNDNRADGKGIGYATYTLKVLVPDSLKMLALEIPQLYSSYKLWVNGNLIASAGTVGVKKETAVAQWIHQTATFNNPLDTLQIVLQIANFHHYKGGAKDPVYLGTPDRIDSHFAWALGSNLVEASILMLEGFFFLFFYRKRKKSVILYFALLCLTWSLRSVFSNLYPATLLWPDMNWQLLVKIEYITLYLTAVWAALFFNSLFKDISNVIFIYLPIALNLFFIVFTLLTPAVVFSRWISVYLGVAALVILYGATMIVRALIVEREGSWFLMLSLGVGVLVFGYDIAAYQGSLSYNVVWLNMGYVAIFILTTIALLFHLGIFKNKIASKKMLTYSDLFQSNKNKG